MSLPEKCTCEKPQFAMFNNVSAGWGENERRKYMHLLGKPICFFCGESRNVPLSECDQVTGGTIALRLDEIERA